MGVQSDEIERGSGAPDAALRGFRHEAVFYAGEGEFLATTLPFIRDGLDAGEAVRVAVSAAKIRMLEDELGADAGRIEFLDIETVGRNPARIIPVWREFLDLNAGAGAGMRGIGEPAWPSRGPAEMIECQHHESLLNLAFSDAPSWQLLCPYDTAGLDDDVLAAAEQSHPHLSRDGAHEHSRNYVDPKVGAVPFTGDLPEPAGKPRVIAFVGGELSSLRRFAGDCAQEAGLVTSRRVDFVLAANEIAGNSVRHGGGHGVMRIWREDGALLCEVADEGWIDQPLVGRVRPLPEQAAGRGLWVANQVCDLVQIRSGEQGTTVRLHMDVDDA
jgi:anti-sigma regulatory factor (Ser/Thr protein kinase)